MLLNQNKHLHNLKNFDNYRNIYAVRMNESKIDSITYNLLNDGNLRYKYNIVQRELFLYFAIDEDISIRGYYKIIYGHFYNNSNEFLYKKLNNKKTYNFEVFKCNKNELLHNKLKEYLIYSDSYDALDKQIINIAEEKIYEIKQHFIKPFDVLYSSEVVSIHTNDNSNINFIYDDECINIISN